MNKNTLKARFNDAYHKLVIIQVVGEFILIYPLYSIMFSERSGISAAGIGLLLGAWQLSQILAEVPTGILADRFSKKYSIIIGKALKAICYLTWLVSPNFAGYFFGFMLWGIGEAFTSGSTQAYLYELSGGEKSTNYLKSFSRLQAYMMTSYVVAYIFTFLIGTNYPLLLALSSAAVLLSSLLGFTLPESEPTKLSSSRLVFSDGISRLKKSRILRRKFIEGLVILSTLTTLIEIIVINYRDFGVPSRVVPLVISAVALLNALLFWSLNHYQKLFRKYLIHIAAGSTLVYLVLFGMTTWWQVVGLFIASRFMRVAGVVQESDLQDDLHNNSRATVLSLYSLAGKLGSAFQLFVIGLLATDNDITIPTLWLIVLTVIFFAVLYVWFDAAARRNAATEFPESLAS